ncbi:S24 family peptidase [Mesonia sp. K7]|uniref:S24 family peptidase n=1 Tax=Mesonia sp. K7 TaxID=2218606 RepID=UPI000DA8DA77|nr:S24 family peptidase [Mesonia sp. K7]PZD77236.1 peptidase S24 [Mesonia sp. K7]
MDINDFGKLDKTAVKHQQEFIAHTGFPSAATHYAEPSIDLNEVLIRNKDATFFVRIEGNKLSEVQIFHNDVLIIDRSISPKNNQLVLVIEDGVFKVKRMASQLQQEEMLVWGVITYVIHAVK